MNIKNIDKKDIFGFLIAFLVAFVMFKNIPFHRISYNPYKPYIY